MKKSEKEKAEENLESVTDPEIARKKKAADQRARKKAADQRAREKEAAERARKKEAIRKARKEDVAEDAKKLKEKNDEYQESARKNRFFLWTIFTVGLIIILVATFVISLKINLYLDEAILLSSGICFVLLLYTFIKGYIMTPHNHEDIIEVVGKYVGKPKKSGPSIVFPFSNQEIVNTRVYLGIQEVNLFFDNKDGHRGDLEFEHLSAAMKATIFFQIIDSEKAVYAVDDLMGALEDESDELIRSFFGRYTIDEAIRLKSVFDLKVVASLQDVSSNTPNGKVPVDELGEIVVTQEEAEDTHFFRLFEKWGVKPVELAISDLQLPESVKEERARMLNAKKNKEVAAIDLETERIKKKIDIVKAEAKREGIVQEGMGEAGKMKSVIDTTNLSPEDTANYLLNSRKWDSLKSADVTLIEDSGGKTSEGVKLGLGIGASMKKK